LADCKSNCQSAEEGLEDWLTLAQPSQPRAWLVYGGDENHHRKDTGVISWRNFPALTDLTG
jgi:hypothetical protein